MTIEQAKEFILLMLDKLGGGFHPDDDIEEYVTWEWEVHDGQIVWLDNAKEIFGGIEAIKLQEQLDKCHEAFANANECIYEYTIKNDTSHVHNK